MTFVAVRHRSRPHVLVVTPPLDSATPADASAATTTKQTIHARWRGKARPSFAATEWIHHRVTIRSDEEPALGGPELPPERPSPGGVRHLVRRMDHPERHRVV